MPTIQQKSKSIRTLVLLALLGACLAAIAARPAVGLAAPLQPALAFQSGSYDFGLQRVNSGGSQATLQLQNVSDSETLGFESLSISGPGSGSFWIGNSECYGRMLAPGNTCWVQVYFNPSNIGEFDAQLHATAGGYGAVADLTGSGGQAIFEATPNPTDFGVAAVGGPGTTREIEVVNNGNFPGGFFIALISGGAVGSFQLLDENCTGHELAPSATCNLQVRFQPLSQGAKTATLSLFGDQDGGVQIALTGVGTPAAPAASNPTASLQVPPAGSTTVNSVVNVKVGDAAANRRAKARQAAARRALRRHRQRRLSVRTARLSGGTVVQGPRLK